MRCVIPQALVKATIVPESFTVTIATKNDRSRCPGENDEPGDVASSFIETKVDDVGEGLSPELDDIETSANHRSHFGSSERYRLHQPIQD